MLISKIPTHVSDVHVVANTRIRVGKVEANYSGNAGATQYQLLQDIPSESFYNTRELKK